MTLGSIRRSGIRFEWDTEKTRSNKRDHGVTFNQAISAFFDSGAIVLDDLVTEEGEERFHLIGITEAATLLLIVHCYRTRHGETSIASSQRERPRPANGSSIVTQTPDAGWRLSSADVEALKNLDEMPDDQIRTDLVPELPREAWARAVKNPYAAELREQTRRKAS